MWTIGIQNDRLDVLILMSHSTPKSDISLSSYFKNAQHHYRGFLHFLPQCFTRVRGEAGFYIYDNPFQELYNEYKIAWIKGVERCTADPFLMLSRAFFIFWPVSMNLRGCRKF